MRHGKAVWSAVIVAGLIMVATPASAQPAGPQGAVPGGELTSVLQPVTTPLNEAAAPVTEALAPLTQPAEPLTAAIQDTTGIDLSADPAPDPVDSTTPARPASGSRGHDPGTPAGTSSSSGVSVQADGESGLAVDANVADVASVCVRLDPDGADGPLAATIRLLDQDLLAGLQDAGLPVDELVVPCPDEVGTPADRADDDTSGGAAGGTSGERPGPAAVSSRVPSADRLPYTGSPVAGLTAAGVGLLLSGAALLRRFRRSAAPA